MHFHRIDDLSADGGMIVPLSRGQASWLPCSEVRGEGVFFRFDEDRVLDWEERYRLSGAAGEVRQGHRLWRARRGLDPEEGWPGERYVLLHSFAHALIREFALECGYTASSIREGAAGCLEHHRAHGRQHRMTPTATPTGAVG